MAFKNETEGDVERIEDPNEAKVTVDLEPPDDDDKDDGDETPRAAQGAGEKQRDPATGKWTQKKQARNQEHKEKSAWRAEKADIERRMADQSAAFQRQLAEAVASAGRTAQTQQAAAAPDPFEAKLTDIGNQLESELALIERDEKRGYKRYNELRREEYKIVAQREAANMFKAQQASQRPQSPQAAQYAARGPIIESEYPWTNDPRCAPLNAKAWAYRTMLIEVEGRPDTIDTDREALAHVAAKFGAQFGLQAPAAPSQAQRGAWSRPGPGSAAAANGRQRPSSIELPSALVEGTGLSPQALAAALREVD